MKRTILMTLAALVIATGACKSDDASTKGETATVTETTGPEAPANTNNARPSEFDPTTLNEDTKFGVLVDGTTVLTVTPVEPGNTENVEAMVVEEADWIAKFVAAIGPEVAGNSGVPKCLPKYRLAFGTADGAVATFSGVCAGGDTVVLVKDGMAFTAADPETAHTMLETLSNAD